MASYGICSPLDDRRQNFEAAHLFIFQVFSKYPKPGELIGCRCCTGNHFINPFNKNDLCFYLLNSCLLGTEDDFKYYLPFFLELLYINQDKEGESSIFISNISSIRLLPKEDEAIMNWFAAYLQFKYIEKFEINVQTLRAKAQDWLNNVLDDDFYFEFPFSTFSAEYNEIKEFLSSATKEDFSNILDLWPQNELDLIAFSLIINQLFLNVVMYANEIFPMKNIELWLSNIEKRLEEYFWETSNPKLQQLLSDSLQIMINVKKSF